jgi:hypothetical protein
MTKKIAQYTKLDKSLLPRDYIDYSFRHKEILPFEDWATKEDMVQSLQQQKEKSRIPKEPLKLKYPDLTPEMIKYRGLNEQELQRLKKEDEADYEYRQKYRYWQKDEPFVPSGQRYYELNKALPEDVKKEILAKYSQLQKVATEFQAKYNEANELAARNVELNYNGSYIDLFRNFGRFIVANIHRYLGVLFGTLPQSGRRSYNYSSRATNLAEFINKGINLFNITPLNVETKLHEMSSAIHAMNAIIEEYERKKKVLKKLPQIDVDIKKFLLNRENRAFLKWMDEYFPNDKKEFMENAINSIMDESTSIGTNFQIGQLKNVKVYSDAYWKAKQTATRELYYKMENQVRNEIISRLTEEINAILKPKVLDFAEVVSNTTIDNLDQLVKYIYRNFKFDLRSVFQFVQMSMQKYYADQDNGEKDRTGLTLTEERFLYFKRGFLEDIKDKAKSLIDKDWRHTGIEDLVKEYLAKYIQRGEKIKHKELSELSSKDFNDIVNKYFANLIISKLPNFSKTGWSYEYALPGFQGAGKLLEETGKFSIESIVNYANKLVPFVPKEFILHLVKSLFKNQIPESDTITSADAGFEEIRHLAGTTQEAAMKVFLNVLKKTGKYNADSFTNEFIKYFHTVNVMVGKFTAEFFHPTLEKNKKFSSYDEIIDLFSLIIRNFETLPKDNHNFIAIMDFMHNSAGHLDKKDITKLFANKNYVAYSKVGIVKKVFNAYAMIRNLGGIKGIYQKYGNILETLKQDGFISKNFDANLRFIVKVFNSGEEINPSKPFFKRLFVATSATETDLQAIEMGSSLREMLRDYQDKDKRLFNLDLQINDRLRFRVLKDKDPRMLRVGIESNCCQRIGGVGEAAARDSFMNPLAGVLVLEWKNQEGQWVLLAQSYFHYVPKDNSFVLDNVEYNQNNYKESGINLEAAYNYLAQMVKEKMNIKYFISGKGYSKINANMFKTYKLRGGDPRVFDRRSGSKYTDFSPSNSIDLLNPKINFDKEISKLTGRADFINMAFNVLLSKIIKTSMI